MPYSGFKTSEIILSSHHSHDNKHSGHRTLYIHMLASIFLPFAFSQFFTGIEKNLFFFMEILRKKKKKK